MNADLIKHFWTTDFVISKDRLPINECLQELVILQLLKAKYPHLATNDAQLAADFRRCSLNLDLGLRYIKVNHLSYYNAKRLLSGNEQTSISLTLLNSRGLITQSENKCDFLNGIITSLPTEHVVVITESHLTPNHTDGEITNNATFKNYTLHRADRDTEIGRKSKNGGVLVLTSPAILSTKGEKPYSNGCCELLITELNEISTTLICFYRPPDTTKDEFADVLTKAKTYLNNHPINDIIVTGDFNFPPDIVVWKATEDGVIPFATPMRSDERKDARKEQFQDLMTFTNEFFLQQVISKPTRGANILDLVFSNSPHRLHSPLIAAIPTSDHNLIQLKTTYGTKVKQGRRCHEDRPEICKFNFSAADATKVKEKLQQANLSDIVRTSSTRKEAKDNLISKIIECAQEAGVPEYKDQHHSNSGQNSRELHNLFKKRIKILQKMRCKMHYGQQHECQEKLNTVNADIQRVKELLNAEREKKQIQNLKSDPGAFYKYAKQNRESSTQIGPLKFTINGKQTYESGPLKMAEILSKQYESVFTAPQNGPRQFNFPVNSELSDIDFSPSDIVNAIKSISPTSAPGPDGITPKFLKDYADELAEPLCILWRMSLDSGDNPDGTHLAFITALFKSGDKSEPANYRPVALTNHITKIFERIIKNELVLYLTTHQLYNESQHGFRKARSTQTNLIEYYESIIHQLETNRAVDSIYLDFSKAFDKCDHGIILDKLSALGIKGKLYNWLEDFLRNRQQIVVIDGFKSKAVKVTSGVPQGSVLGPILFLILMYDISSGITSSILSSFADDTKIWKAVNSINCDNQLQNDLNNIYNWAIQNNMEFNDKKFQAIRFYMTMVTDNYTDSAGAYVQFVDNVKDLGITISDDLSFDDHINKITGKGRQMAGWILRVFTSRALFLMKILLKQLVLPRIEYCCVLWSPRTQDLIQQLESVQRYFTKRVHFKDGGQPDYWERLKLMKIFSVERRRERYIILYTWKVLHNIYPNPGLKLTVMFPTAHDQHPANGLQIQQYNERSGIIICHIDSHTLPSQLKARSVLNKCCELFNCLPSKLRCPTPPDSLPDPARFKALLDKWLASIPDQPTIPGRFRPAITNSILHQKDYKA